jgi:DNA-binding transcriptional ArsR family regulator
MGGAVEDGSGGVEVYEEPEPRVQLITLYMRVLLELSRRPRISQETLARRLDVTMRTAQRHLTELEEEGYIHVDRDKKPFQYSINWSKEWPHMAGLRLILCHPEVAQALSGLSDVAFTAWESAEGNGVDSAQALRHFFAREREEAGAGSS